MLLVTQLADERMHEDQGQLSRRESIRVTRRPEKFHSDDARVITRFFSVGGENRVRAVIERIMALSQREVDDLLGEILRGFGSRHKDLVGSFHRHFDQVRGHVDDPERLSENRRLLSGAHFTMEYSIESAALFNPSIVLHPDIEMFNNGMPPGDIVNEVSVSRPTVYRILRVANQDGELERPYKSKGQS